jgi:nucleolar protein 56
LLTTSIFLTTLLVENGFISLTQACIGMAHSLSRNLIKFDVKRNDKPIMQSYSLIDTMEKNLNTFVMRLKEWYGYHFPELNKLVTDNEVYARVVHFIGNKDTLTEDMVGELEEIVSDGEIAQRIYDVCQISVGNDLGEIDEECLKAFGAYVVSHYDFKKQMQGFMKEKMDFITPNLTALIGESVRKILKFRFY